MHQNDNHEVWFGFVPLILHPSSLIHLLEKLTGKCSHASPNPKPRMGIISLNIRKWFSSIKLSVFLKMINSARFKQHRVCKLWAVTAIPSSKLQDDSLEEGLPSTELEINLFIYFFIYILKIHTLAKFSIWDPVISQLIPMSICLLVKDKEKIHF